MNTENSNVDGRQISIKKGQLTVSRLYVGDYQKEGTQTAELKQVVETITSYPSSNVRNDMQDNPFANNDFGFEKKDFQNTRTDVAWIDVPKGVTLEQVQAKVAVEGSTLYRVLSNRPILHSGQQNYINRIKTEVSGKTEEEKSLEVTIMIDKIAERQLVRYSDQDAERAGQLILDGFGKPQYKATFFSSKNKIDEDLRNSDPSDFYASESVKAELNKTASVIEDQTVSM